MLKNKKVFLFVFALVIVGLNVAIYTWTQSLKAEEVTYLKEKRVDNLAFDNQGRVWTYSGGELRLYEKGDLIRAYTEKDSPALGGKLQELAVDNMGKVWVAPNGQDRTVDLAVFDGTQWSTLFPGSASSDRFGGVTAISFDAQGRAWIGVHRKGLYIIDGEAWENYTAENSDLIANYVDSIAFDRKGRAWIETFETDNLDPKGGLNIFDGKAWETFDKSTEPLFNHYLGTINFDNQGRAWIGYGNGASILDGENWVSYKGSFGSSGRFVFDNQGRAWMNSTNMIKVFDGENWKYYFDPRREFPQYGSKNHVMAADRDGNIWVATYPKGMVIITPDSAQPTSYAQGASSFALVSGGWVYLTILLLVVWLAVTFNTWSSIGVVLAGIPIYLIWIATGVSPNTIDDYDRFLFFDDNPAIFGTIGGIIGGTVEILLKRLGKAKTARWGLIGFIVGSVISFCILGLGRLMQ